MHFKIPKNVTFPPSTKKQIGKSRKLISPFKERKEDAVTREEKFHIPIFRLEIISTPRKENLPIEIVQS
jgi:hypothetical protein